MLREQLLKGKRVLIVEDNGTMASVLSMMVRWLGGRSIEIASTFDAALSCCELNRYDLLFFDIELDGKRDGIALASAIRERGWGGEALLIFVTGNMSRQAVDAALQVRPDGYITKPLSAQMLASVVYKAQTRRSIREDSVEGEPKESSNARVKPIEESVESAPLEVKD